MPTYLRADVGGGCGCICTYIYGWMGGCLRIPTDGCRRRAMPASVEADGHVRVAASVPVDGARLSGADKGARAPANWSPPVPASVSLGQRLSMARALACRRPACPRGSRQLVTLPPARAAPPAAPTRPANWPPRARLRASPSSSSSPSSPSSPSLRRPRARDSLLASRARAYRAPSPPQPTPLNRDPRARRRRPFSYTYPPTSPGPSSCAQTFPGPNVVPGGGPPAPADRAPPVRPCAPANWSLPFVTRRRRRAGPRGHLGRPTGESPWRWRSRGDRPSPVPPRVSGERCLGPPPSARRCRAR